MSAIEVLKMWVKTIDTFPNCKELRIQKGEFDTLREILKQLEKGKVGDAGVIDDLEGEPTEEELQENYNIEYEKEEMLGDSK